jgi:abequosyltransferase
LFSADDFMINGAIAKVLKYITSDYDVYMCEHTLCDYDMHPIKRHPIFVHSNAPTIFDLNDPVQRKLYFREARTSEAFFSFLSVPIFKRTLWERSKGIPESFYGTCWALAGRFLSAIPKGFRVQYLAESFIYKRSDNDSFMERGAVHRLRITVDGFTHIAETVFGKDSQETLHIRRVLRNERRLPHLLNIKLIVSVSLQKDKMIELNQLVYKFYSHVGIINKCKYILFRITPIWALKLCLLFINTFTKRHLSPEKVKA